MITIKNLKITRTNQLGMLSLHTLLPIIIAVTLIGGIGAYVFNDSRDMPAPEGGITVPKPGPFVFFSQNSDPWGDERFKGSDNPITRSGCGLTSYSMIAATLLNDKSKTPYVYVKAFQKSGKTLTDTERGVQVAAFGKQLYGLNYYRIDGTGNSSEQSQVKTALRSGKMLMAGGGYALNNQSLGGSYGHIMVLRSIDANNVVSVANPWDKTNQVNKYPLAEVAKHTNYYVAVYR